MQFVKRNKIKDLEEIKDGKLKELEKQFVKRKQAKDLEEIKNEDENLKN